jgi:hypothetical protein
MKVLACNTPVGLAGSSLRGTILAICVRGALVTYEVAWFVGDNRCTGWFQESELTVAANVRRMGL